MSSFKAAQGHAFRKFFNAAGVVTYEMRCLFFFFFFFISFIHTGTYNLAHGQFSLLTSYILFVSRILFYRPSHNLSYRSHTGQLQYISISQTY